LGFIAVSAHDKLGLSSDRVAGNNTMPVATLAITRSLNLFRKTHIRDRHLLIHSDI